MSFSSDLKKHLMERNNSEIKKLENKFSNTNDYSIRKTMLNYLHLDLIGVFFSANFDYIEKESAFTYVTEKKERSLYFFQIMSDLNFKVKYEKKFNRYYLKFSKKDYIKYITFLQDYIYSEEFLYDLTSKAKRFYTSMFIASGHIFNPDIKYLIDFYVLDLEKFSRAFSLNCILDFNDLFIYLNDLFNSIKKKTFEINFNLKQVKLKNNDIKLYLKKAEDIISFLNLMEATKFILEIENIRVFKQIKNNINRVVNFEMANMNKSMDARSRQLNASEYIINNNLEMLLTKKQLEVVNARLKNPDIEMKELAEILGISKSSITNRFKSVYDIITKEIKKDGK